MDNNYNVVVIGAGIQGSCTALYLASQGKKTLLLDQFSLPHTRGSSGGESRLIRTAYEEDFFTIMMKEAFEMWKKIEDETKENILIRSGVVIFSQPPHDCLNMVEQNMARLCPNELEKLTIDEAKERFPLHNFTNEHKAFFDKSGGTIKAKIALQAVQRLFLEKGGQIRSPFSIKSLDIREKEITIKGSEETIFKADSIVLCCGPWTNKVLERLGLNLQLPLRPERVNVFYFKEKTENLHTLSNKFLPFLDFKEHIYGFPSLEYPGCVKICIHFGTPCDPDERDKVSHIQKDREKLLPFIEKQFPTLESTPAIVETCMYTVSPDECYFLDHHPLHKNVIIGAGFSGTGFKISPLVGKILGNLAMGLPNKYDMNPFKISRFST